MKNSGIKLAKKLSNQDQDVFQLFGCFQISYYMRRYFWFASNVPSTF